MSVYLDASVLVALFTDDAFTERADNFLRHKRQTVIVSDFAATEFAAIIARHVRTGDISAKDADTTFTNFDIWLSRAAQHVQIGSADVAAAERFIRRLDLTLRAPDAIHIAISDRVADDLLTFDRRMAASARALGVRLAIE